MDADDPLFLVLGEVADPATAPSQSEFPELSPQRGSSCPLWPLLTSPSVLGPRLPLWRTLKYAVENNAGQAKLREHADRLRGLKTNLCCFGLAKLSPGVRAESDMVLIEA